MGTVHLLQEVTGFIEGYCYVNLGPVIDERPKSPKSPRLGLCKGTGGHVTGIFRGAMVLQVQYTYCSYIRRLLLLQVSDFW